MADRACLTSPDTAFKSRVNSLSAITATLFRLLGQIDTSSGNIADLPADLARFHDFLIILTPHIETDSQSNDELCDASCLSELLKNAETCLDRMHTILMQGKREEVTMNSYLQQSKPRKEMKHLRARLHVCTSALKGPVLLASVNTVRGSLGRSFSKLAFASISNWHESLAEQTILFASDKTIWQLGESSSQVTEASCLFFEREELVKIIQFMVGTAMNMLHTARQERCSQSTESSPPERPRTSWSAVPGPEIHIAPNAVLEFQRLALNRVHQRNTLALHQTPPSGLPPPYHNESAESGNQMDLSNSNYTLFDDIATQISRNYINAQSLLVLCQPLEAHDLLEQTVALSHNLPSAMPVLSTTVPSTTDILFLLVQACLQTDPKRITRARSALRSIYASHDAAAPPSYRHEAAHMLAELYMFHDGNPLDMEADNWHSPDIDLKKAKDYVIAAVKGRKRVLGVSHADTQRSLELLSKLVLKVQMARGVDGVERQRVLDELVGWEDNAIGCDVWGPLS